MQTIWKFPITQPRTEVQMPALAVVLKLETQHNTPCLWALVDPDMPLESREFSMVGTGHHINFEATRTNYIGSCLLVDGTLVLHVFDTTYSRGGKP